MAFNILFSYFSSTRLQIIDSSFICLPSLFFESPFLPNSISLFRQLLTETVKISEKNQDDIPSTNKKEKEAPEPELDIAGESFDPLRALYAKDYRVTLKEPRMHFQNLAAFETAFKKQGIFEMHRSSKQSEQSTAGTSTAATSQKNELDPNLPTRRFTPNQMAIRTQKPDPSLRNRHNRNIFNHMSEMRGPMAQLHLAVVDGRRIVVRTRSEHGIRGRLEGRIILFDKHWNLVLVDVLEIWQRRKFQHGENKTSAAVAEDCTSRLEELGLVLPTQCVRSIGRKNVEISRKLDQILVRGEQVALVVIPVSKEKKS